MKQKVIYGVRLDENRRAWLTTIPLYGFHDNVLGGNIFTTYDVNKAHRFAEWMSSSGYPSVVEEKIYNTFYV